VVRDQLVLVAALVATLLLPALRLRVAVGAPWLAMRPGRRTLVALVVVVVVAREELAVSQLQGRDSRVGVVGQRLVTVVVAAAVLVVSVLLVRAAVAAMVAMGLSGGRIGQRSPPTVAVVVVGRMARTASVVSEVAAVVLMVAAQGLARTHQRTLVVAEAVAGMRLRMLVVTAAQAS